jgi:hypothetical protein
LGRHDAGEDHSYDDLAHASIVPIDAVRATADSPAILLSMRFVSNALVVLTSLAACISAQEAQTRLKYDDLLFRMTFTDWLQLQPEPGERCVQFSSYDRESNTGPGVAEKWYANHDRGHYLRVESLDGIKEHVMVDVAGAGVLARLWSTNPSGTA